MEGMIVMMVVMVLAMQMLGNMLGWENVSRVHFLEF
jgi:hypothetical protein